MSWYKDVCPECGNPKNYQSRWCMPCSRRLQKRTPKQNVNERFWSYVDTSGGSHACWLWKGGLDTKGYGLFMETKRKAVRAHRFAYQSTYNIVLPSEIEVCHNCPSGDTPACCNPTHLFPGSHSDNMVDMVSKGRHNKAILNADKVRDIRQSAANGVAAHELALLYGVTPTSIYRVIRGTTWSHVH